MSNRQRILLCVAMGVAIATVIAAQNSHADTLDIREWLVPWPKSAPADPAIDARGRVWFVSPDQDYIGNFTPETEEFNRYDVRPGSEPVALLLDANRKLWFAAYGRHSLGQLNTGTGQAVEIVMPVRKAKRPRAIAFDSKGDIWFALEDGEFVGRLQVPANAVVLIDVPGDNAEPVGITIDGDDQPWFVGADRGAIFSIDATAMTVAAYDMPDKNARPRRIVTTADGRLWYTDFANGRLGRFDPEQGAFATWQMPGGEDSEPFGLAVDENDRLWIVETGSDPSRLVGFDTATGRFLTETDIPSGAGVVSDLNYHPPSGEIWFGTETNYLGRAKIN